jgi:hypothetical protein
MRTRTKAGIKFDVVQEWTDETNYQIIRVNNAEYRLDYIPRNLCRNYADLSITIVNGIRYLNLKQALIAISK